MKMRLTTCACAPGMDSAKPTIAVPADKQKETASLWKFMVDTVFVVVIIKFRRNSKIYVKIEEVCIFEYRKDVGESFFVFL